MHVRNRLETKLLTLEAVKCPSPFGAFRFIVVLKCRLQRPPHGRDKIQNFGKCGRLCLSRARSSSGFLARTSTWEKQNSKFGAEDSHGQARAAQALAGSRGRPTGSRRPPGSRRRPSGGCGQPASQPRTATGSRRLIATRPPHGRDKVQKLGKYRHFFVFLVRWCSQVACHIPSPHGRDKMEKIRKRMAFFLASGKIECA